jgi:hypothetical protein
MSTIKNFGLAGVGADIQFGKGGPRLIQSGGAFSLKNAANNATTTLDVAAPTADTHAANRLFVNTGLSATRTGAGLSTADGTYTANASGFYIVGATSLKDADQKLDTNLKRISEELDVTQTGAGLNAAGTYTANATGNYVNGATSLKNADDKLDFALFTLQGEVNTIESAAGLGIDGTLPAWSATNYITGTGSLRAAIVALDTQLKTASDNLAAIGNAFNYVGTVSGGASSGAATDLALQSASGKNPGDYYKVAVAGWFKVGAGAAFYANLGDGLVWNLSNDIDKIDNTDSSVTGTANRISVTGSTDNGYVVDIASNYVGQNTITTLGTVTTGTWSASAIAVDKGGTGLTTYTAGDLIYATGSTTLAKLAKGSTLQVLRMNAGATAPEYFTLNATAVPFSDASYTATNVSTALVEVKASLAAMTGDTITSGNTSVSTAGSTITFYDDISAAKTAFLNFDGTAVSATIAAAGSGANVNLVLDPKGTGTVDVSSAKITSVANATTATDALPFGQSKAIHTSYMVADLTEANTNITIGAINGLILRVMVYLSAPYQSGSTLTIGYAGSQSILATATEIEHTLAGIYVIDNVVPLNQTIVAYVTGTGTGAGKVIIEYLAV